MDSFFSAASGTAMFTEFATSTGGFMLIVIAAVLGAGGILLGLGYAWSRTKKHVTGRKF